ncbi:hypothetical protein EX30DRAFT_394133 [Ascodesmis nigricans]|uniref:Uncharacterized protein n=1 Tax=Ascodesmis nigricans TaxID=341454 RepID=A0A4S2N169_9PEZI|nr:hypothetical protein EX30DRAFT_394133 [Ascodesmis nigricans]
MLLPGPISTQTSPHRTSPPPQLTTPHPSSIPHYNLTMGGGGKIPYPKHVWSPAGGWYSQPSNWRANTLVMVGVIATCAAFAWKVSAERERRYVMPDPDRFYPSRWWTRQIREYEQARREEAK